MNRRCYVTAMNSTQPAPAERSVNGFVEALRHCRPGTTIEARGYRVSGSASTLVRDYDALLAEVERLEAEVARWRSIALALDVLS